MVPANESRLDPVQGRQNKHVAGPEIAVLQRFGSAEFGQHLRAHRLLILEPTQAPEQAFAQGGILCSRTDRR